MGETFTIAALQAAFGTDMASNIAQVETLCRQAAAGGAQIILPPELFQGPYFCKQQDEAEFAHAYPVSDHPCVKALQPLARELGVVIPVSIFEKEGPHYFNSVVVLDADGTDLGVYRKSHIPDGPGYQEKFYFRPGDTGFKVFQTSYGRMGVGICWDQWFPEAARAMAVQGAEMLLYPTAIGAEPQDDTLDTKDRWQRVMQGHAVANVLPVMAANRVGDEDGQLFYGSSFICDQTGEICAEMDRRETGWISASFNRAELAREQAAWGFFRDRRTDLYPGFFSPPGRSS